MEFVDLKITGLSDTVERSDSGSAMRMMHLILSGTPTSEWVTLFENERAFPRHTMWRRAYITGSHIVVDCVPEEIEKYHLKDLKDDVANTNAKYRTWLNKVEAQERAQQAQAAAEKKRVDDLKGRLKFD
jgi:hypothetical protein